MSNPMAPISRRSLIATAAAAPLLGRISGALAQATPEAEIPKTPAGEQLAWVFARIDPGQRAATEAELDEHFTASFLKSVPASQLLAVFSQLRSEAGPVSLVGFDSPPTETEIVAQVLTKTSEPWIVYVQVLATEPYKISSLLFQPASDTTEPVELTDFAELERRWTGFAESASFLVAELSESDPKIIYSYQPDLSLAIGSTFKLYVLGALGQKISDGNWNWDAPLEIQDSLKSLPSGDLQNQPDGTAFPVRTFAEKMISISDNTAADHLIAFAGRESVEAMLPVMGHSDPSLDIPFLKTRDMFALKLAAPKNLVDRYIAAGADDRREILDVELPALDVSLESAAGWISPRNIDTIEWFATTSDLVAAMSWHRTRMAEPGLEPIADVLSINPGVPFNTTTWPYVGFKGGSEPGVLNLTWLVRRKDDRWFVVSGTLNDQSKLIEESVSAYTAAGVFGLLESIK